MQSALSNSQMTLCILSEIAENVANWWFRAQGLKVPKVRFSVEEDFWYLGSMVFLFVG